MNYGKLPDSVANKLGPRAFIYDGNVRYNAQILFNRVSQEGYEMGYANGHQIGYNMGYDEGYDNGLADSNRQSMNKCFMVNVAHILNTLQRICETSNMTIQDMLNNRKIVDAYMYFALNDSTPVSADNSTPVSANNSTPVSANNSTPVSANNSTPVSANNSTPVSADNSTLVVTDSTPVVADSTPVSANNSTPVSADNSTPVSADNSTLVVTDSTPVVTDSTPVVADSTPVSANNSTPVSANNSTLQKPIIKQTTPLTSDLDPSKRYVLMVCVCKCDFRGPTQLRDELCPRCGQYFFGKLYRAKRPSTSLIFEHKTFNIINGKSVIVSANGLEFSHFDHKFVQYISPGFINLLKKIGFYTIDPNGAVSVTLVSYDISNNNYFRTLRLIFVEESRVKDKSVLTWINKQGKFHERKKLNTLR